MTLPGAVGAWSALGVRQLSAEAKLPRVYFDLSAGGQVRLWNQSNLCVSNPTSTNVIIYSSESGSGNLRAEERRGAAHGGELPSAVHGRARVRVQGLLLPPRDPAVHVPGRGLHQP